MRSEYGTRLRRLGLLLVLAVLPGCVTEFAAEKIVAPPNGGRVVLPLGVEASDFLDQALVVSVGPPEAQMMAWVVEPKRIDVFTTADPESLPPPPNAAVREVRTGPTRQGNARGMFQVMRYPAPGTAWARRAAREPRGTVVLLQGYSAYVRQNSYLWPWAGVFADAGYRVVMPDLRGHGDSTGDRFTWGVVEARDVSQLVDELDRAGLLAGKLAVFGHSTGGSVAIATAVVDRRVAAVIAVSPWATMREAVGGFVNWRLRPLRWLFNDAVLDRATELAGRLARFDPHRADAVTWISQTRVPVLLLHGEKDQVVSVDHSRQLYAARPQNSRLVIFEGRDHWSHMELDFDRFRELCLGFLAEHLDDGEEAVRTETAGTPGVAR